MDVVHPEPPIGQFFLVSRHLRKVFAAAPFDGTAWQRCVAAFLAYPGVPVLASNATTQAPASFFLRLFEGNPPGYPTDTESPWPELVQRLSELGNQRVVQLIATDATQSWVIFLNEALDQVLAFGGRTRPGPRYSFEDDEEDRNAATPIRHLISGLSSTRVVRFDHSRLGTPTVHLADDSGHHYVVGFQWLSAQRYAEYRNY